ncbi:RNA polymerase-binding protein RbpA [Mycolicibacterium murale]|jgi:hypothetical protein|uniref:RNA polymerase-binding protein RbpA n=1 Tax=Mycolicibacterium murale TaxID=182220 RepID=A0A7I9WP14_9MYCO|nr:RNA polymerase-binding protein RbpA [Mycolicibacterium murale]MCV7180388.1 RNA polymerase-binding protein RbpA [Mycolicibacterium murale]GFG59403.1 RNA polymerase-binding protein RbpA [Mycolicibacterium murale]
MANQRIKGSRLGAISYETDRNVGPPPTHVARYRTANGQEFDVPFADDAVIPGIWACRNGMDGILLNGEAPSPKKGRRVRTHWDMVLERRSLPELEALFEERMAVIQALRRGGR